MSPPFQLAKIYTMRILYICGDQGIPAFGRKGASTHLREMIAALRQQGHEISLASADIAGDRRPEEDFPVVKLPKPKSRLLGLDGRYLTANHLAKSILKKAIEEIQPDGIYERSALYFNAGGQLAKKFGIPRILEVNALLSLEQKTRLHFPKLAWKYELDLLRKSQATAAISGYMARRLADFGCAPWRIRQFPMAVDPHRFRPPPDPEHRRQELDWSQDDIVLGYVGSMNSYHRPNWFMDLAEKILRRKQKGIRFLIVGGVAYKVQRHRSRLLKWVEEGLVHFTGSVPQSEMSSWLAAMNVVLVPGAAPQSTPTKIFEAAAVGRPVILPATEPIRELCGDDAPYLFKPNEYLSFEENVREFIAEPTIFDDQVQILREKVLQEHTWEKQAIAVTQWLEELNRYPGQN